MQNSQQQGREGRHPMLRSILRDPNRPRPSTPTFHRVRFAEEETPYMLPRQYDVTRDIPWDTNNIPYTSWVKIGGHMPHQSTGFEINRALDDIQWVKIGGHMPHQSTGFERTNALSDLPWIRCGDNTEKTNLRDENRRTKTERSDAYFPIAKTDKKNTCCTIF